MVNTHRGRQTTYTHTAANSPKLTLVLHCVTPPISMSYTSSKVQQPCLLSGIVSVTWNARDSTFLAHLDNTQAFYPWVDPSPKA